MEKWTFGPICGRSESAGTTPLSGSLWEVVGPAPRTGGLATAVSLGEVNRAAQAVSKVMRHPLPKAPVNLPS